MQLENNDGLWGLKCTWNRPLVPKHTHNPSPGIPQFCCGESWFQNLHKVNNDFLLLLSERHFIRSAHIPSLGMLLHEGLSPSTEEGLDNSGGVLLGLADCHLLCQHRLLQILTCTYIVQTCPVQWHPTACNSCAYHLPLPAFWCFFPCS